MKPKYEMPAELKEAIVMCGLSVQQALEMFKTGVDVEGDSDEPAWMSTMDMLRDGGIKLAAASVDFIRMMMMDMKAAWDAEQAKQPKTDHQA